jgi:hypothetical protein
VARLAVIANTRHLAPVLSVFIDHDNGRRAYRSVTLTPPGSRSTDHGARELANGSVFRPDRLGGLLHEHELAA